MSYPSAYDFDSPEDYYAAVRKWADKIAARREREEAEADAADDDTEVQFDKEETMKTRGIHTGPDIPPFVPVILAALLFLGVAPALAGGPDAYDVVEGRIVNGSCPEGGMLESIHVEGNPAYMPDVFRALARCDVGELTFEDQSGRFDEVAFLRELLTYFDARTMHACSSLSECGIRVDTVCGRKGSTGKNSSLELDSRSTATGEACTGTCADGTKVRVLCIKADPKLQV